MIIRLEKKSAEGYIMTADIVKSYEADATLYHATDFCKAGDFVKFNFIPRKYKTLADLLKSAERKGINVVTSNL